MDEFTLEDVPVGEVDAVGNYRVHHNSEDDDRLERDIQANGFRHPLAGVRDRQTRRVRLFGGFRRFMVARKIGKQTVPCLLYSRDLTEGELALENIRDNEFRTNPDPVDEAFGLLRAKQLNELTQKDLALKVGKSESTVCKLLAITQLPDKAHALIRAGRLGVETAYKLSTLADAGVFDELLALAVESPAQLPHAKRDKPRACRVCIGGVSLYVPADVPPLEYVRSTARRILAALKQFQAEGLDESAFVSWLKKQKGGNHV